MIKRAFILSRPYDIDIARMCYIRMEKLGVSAHILVDPREWEEQPADTLPAFYSTKKRGMFGNDCASAILDGMIEHSVPGDRLIKMDCDTWLSQEATDWLTGDPRARAMKINYRQVMPWGGCWSATHEHLLAARAHADTLNRCSCPESALNLRCLNYTPPGLELHPTAIVEQWSPEHPSPSYAATLPIARRRERYTEAAALFQS